MSDLQDHSTLSLIDPMGECTTPLLNLLLVGKAIPYLHNGIIVDDDDEVCSAVGKYQCSVCMYPSALRNSGLLLGMKLVSFCTNETMKPRPSITWALGSRLRFFQSG